MNKKGFTLIEVIATVIILALISLLSFPIILNLVKNEEIKLNEANRTLIKTAASQYTSEFENAFPKIIGNYYCITLYDLVKRDFLINYNNEFNLDTNVLVTVNLDKKYEYDIVGECDSSKIVPSVAIKNRTGVFNSEGWANKNFYVSIIGTGSSYYKCVSDTECVPDTLVNQPSGEEYILTEGNNRVCAKAINNSKESEVVCSDLFKLDTISPTKPEIIINDLSDLKKEVVLITPSVDETSGISHYEYALTSSLSNPNDNELISTDGSTLNLNLTSSDRYIYYRSVDKAGNKSDYISFKLRSGDFNFAINEHGKVDIVDIDLPDNYVLKYLKGNKTATEVINSGYEINSNYFYPSYNDVYTVTAINNDEEVITKKIYVYNGNSITSPIEIVLDGITQIGNVLTYDATATANFNSPNLTINVTNASYYCGDELLQNGDELYCERSYGVDVAIASCASLGSGYGWGITANGNTCWDGSEPEWELSDTDWLPECNYEEFMKGETYSIYGTCTEIYIASNKYTIGVEVE